MQQLGGGKSFPGHSPHLIPQSSDVAAKKCHHRVNLRTKCTDLLDAQSLRWEALYSRVEIIALINVGLLLPAGSQRVGLELDPLKTFLLAVS